MRESKEQPIVHELIVKKSIEVEAPAARVWEIITSPSAMKRWMLAEPEVDEFRPLGVGSNLLWSDRDGGPYLIGTVVTFEPRRNLIVELYDMRWKRKVKPGEVTYAFALFAEDGATHVSFSLGDLSIAPEAQAAYDAYSNGHELESIKQLAEEEEPVPSHGRAQRARARTRR